MTAISPLRHASDVVGSYGSISQALRLLLQSMILGLGAYLVIRQELTAGRHDRRLDHDGSRAGPDRDRDRQLARLYRRAAVAARLSHVLAQAAGSAPRTELPKPARSLDVESRGGGAGRPTAIVANIHFRLMAGEALGVIGPSGSGKTSLVRTLIGIWPPARGKVRLDGAALDQWDAELLGRHIGYVSQTSTCSMAPSPRTSRG